MKTKDYLEKYKLGVNEQFNKIFDKDGLLADLNLELEESINLEVKNRKLKNIQDLPKEILEQKIREIENKFWAISKKRNGYGFTIEYWAHFKIKYIKPILKAHRKI